MKSQMKNAFVVAGGIVAAGLIAGAMSVSVSQTANATAAFSQQTGKPCGVCHQNPAGGGALKPAGQKFKDNGNKL
jgi:hypothetical protein